ncbi:MAG: phosphoenolpyruvate--protein phosphotransferase [Candidatus Omnitrophica bacterium]|nr:phosphoenolpyruvate--protein phosphotransferase [Candidatus Omnitrophota bacterium]
MKLKEMILKGIPAAPGISIGTAYLLDSEEFVIPRRKIKKEDVPLEIERFNKCLAKTRKELLEIKGKIADEMGSEHAEIFSAHLLVIEDPILINDVISRIEKDLQAVETVFLDIMKRYIDVLSKTNDEYLRERVSDINDVGKRVLRNLLGTKQETLETLKEKVIVVAYDLSPSDTALMHKRNVLALVTDIGGRTSHTAIMAKSLEIPAVVGLEVATARIKNGDFLIVDGAHGQVLVNPTQENLKKYELEQRKFLAFERDLDALKELPCQTLDGKRIILAANIEMPEDVKSVLEHKADAVGLYRTEYFYMNRKGLPTEEEHYAACKYVAEKMYPRPVVVRTLDLGGDKFLSNLHVPREMNPFMGWRAIRFCLARPDIFKTQLSAILRASAHGKIKIMYPLISGLDELKRANSMLEEVKDDLRKKNIKFDEKIEVGAMIEVPSAAMTSDILAKEVNFFSIGTNDLIQYSLAVDRVNEKIAYLYEPAHPAVLRFIKTIIDNGHANNIWVGLCGEMAGDVLLTIILVGLGLDHFSMSPVNMLEVKRLIRAISFKKAEKIAEKTLKLATAAEVEAFAREKLKEVAPDLAMGLD